MMFFVYALFSEKFDKIYIGFSTDLDKRLAAHNDPRNTGWTSKFQPWVVIYTEKCITKTIALRREKQLKTSQGRKFVRSLITTH